MSANESKNEASGTKPPSHSRPNHRKVIEELLEVVRKQQAIMEHLSRDLNFTRSQFETNLNYDNGDGDYKADTDYETIDVRAHGMDVGNGIISVDTATDYIAYKVAMNNHEAGFKKTKDQLEKIWEAVDLVQREDEFSEKFIGTP